MKAKKEPKKELEKDYKEENEILEKKNKKLKKFNLILIIIVCIGMLGVISLPILYVYRDVVQKNGVFQRMIHLRNTVNSKYNMNYDYIENVHNAHYKMPFLEDGKDAQPTHPKLLNFEKPWHGYKYYLVYSPYPYGNDKYENPYLYVSNDLINWEIPKGLQNPIENTPEGFVHQHVYNSDPHILYNPDTDRLELYFRYVNTYKNEIIIYRRVSPNGVDWSVKEEIIRMKEKEADCMSPAVIYDEGKYKMWCVNNDLKVEYLESDTGYNYKRKRFIELDYPLKNQKNWHLDVIKTKKGYEMITVGYRDHIDRNSMNLFYFQSKDNINYSTGVIILRPSVISWDNRGIYRSTFIYENNTYYVVYAGISTTWERGIGLAYGEHIENLIGSNIKDAKIEDCGKKKK